MEKTARKIPTKSDYNKYLEISNESNWTDENIDFVNQFDFDTKTFEENGQTGLKNCINEIIIPAKYEDFLILSQHVYKTGSKVATMSKGKWGILTIGNEKWILKPEYDYVGFPNNIIYVVKDEKYGIVNLSTNEFVLPPELEFVSSENGFMFCNGIATYGKNGKEGVMMDNGEFTEAIFDETGVPEMGEYFQVRIGDQWGFINENGEFTSDEDEAYYYACD